MRRQLETTGIRAAGLAVLCSLLSPFGAFAANTVSATQSDIGKVIGADGNVYENKSAAQTAGTVAYAMIAYVNTEEATGLAIAINDIGNGYTWDAGVSKAAEFAANNKVDFGEWRLPSVDDFKYMFEGCAGAAYTSGFGDYSYGSFRTFLVNCGGTNVAGGRYWTQDDESAGSAYQYNFYSARFGSVSKSTTNWIRYCLAFDIASDTAGKTGECRWRYL